MECKSSKGLLNMAAKLEYKQRLTEATRYPETHNGDKRPYNIALGQGFDSDLRWAVACSFSDSDNKAIISWLTLTSRRQHTLTDYLKQFVATHSPLMASTR
jgi:hypothetical protein